MGKRPGQFGGGGASVEAGVVENQILELDERAVEEEARHGFGEAIPRAPAVADRASRDALVETGERVFGSSERRREAGPGEGVEAGGERSHHVDQHGERSVNGSEVDIYFRHTDKCRWTDLTIDKYLLSMMMCTSTL